MIRSVGVKRRSVTVVLALPVAKWPAAAAVTGAVRRVLEQWGGPDAVQVELAVMTDDERAALHRRLAAPSAGADARRPTATATVTPTARPGPRGRPRPARP